jgi:glutamine synthetase
MSFMDILAKSRKWAAPSRVFQLSLLPKKVAEHLEEVRAGTARFDLAYADEIADVLCQWAISLGATHFTHWFQPLRGGMGEKHDSLLVEKLSGKQLLYGEPDASSLPSGGLRVTHSARGYTAWDPASLPFLWENAEGLTLCIPAVFYSWKGEALDHQIPLLRSDQKMGAAGKRLLSMMRVEASQVYSTLGPEQEYFLIDRALYQQRPDLEFSGRTLFGAPAIKGQQLEDHYFGPISERVMGFMREFEQEAQLIGIPIKTRHNEVAPAQHETVPVFERASKASFHNAVLMELMRKAAAKKGLACLFHEKPFAKINGSGKHCNWSIATDTGINFLEPKENKFLFWVTLTAVLRAVHDHAGLLRASIASVGNDHRLGGAEAPPCILSVYLGETLEQLVQEIVQEKTPTAALIKQIDLGLNHLPPHEVDSTDRNRTAFFAFTGNKFEFRAVGASQNCAFPISVLNAIVADSLELILDELGDANTFEAALPILRKHLQKALPVVFEGNNYAVEWHEEAQKRGLPNIPRSYHAFSELLQKKSIRVLEGVLTEREIHSRHEILIEQYAKTMLIEVQAMLDLFQTHIAPAVQKDRERRPSAKKTVEKMAHLLEEGEKSSDEIRTLLDQSKEMGFEAKGKVLCELIAPKMAELRAHVDALEMLVDDSLWPLPKYRKLLLHV